VKFRKLCWRKLRGSLRRSGRESKEVFTKEQWDLFTEQTNGDMAARLHDSVKALEQKLEALKITSITSSV